MRDRCDIETLFSQDCNDNGIPDDCDIRDGTSQDCQPNGVPDTCDIADGTSSDDDGDGIPDECDPIIPAVSEWGLVIMALLLLVGAKVYFNGRRPHSGC